MRNGISSWIIPIHRDAKRDRLGSEIDSIAARERRELGHNRLEREQMSRISCKRAQFAQLAESLWFAQFDQNQNRE